jgi:hypothetical protein
VPAPHPPLASLSPTIFPFFFLFFIFQKI